MFFLFNFLAHTFEVDNIDNMSQELIISQNNCTKLQGDRMYSISKVAECKISLENLYVVPATNTLPKNLHLHVYTCIENEKKTKLHPLLTLLIFLLSLM